MGAYRHYEQLGDSTVLQLMLEDRAAAEQAERAGDNPTATRLRAREEEAFDVLVDRGQRPRTADEVRRLWAARQAALRRVAEGHPYQEDAPEALTFVRPVL